MLHCTVLANCGLHLEYGGDSILIDAPNGQRTAFDAVSYEEGEKMIAGLPPYENLCGLFFTHKHSDHYDRSRVRAAAASRGDFTVFAPNGMTPESGQLRAGAFTVSYFSVPHSGEEFQNVIHRVLLVQVGKHCVYITGDAHWKASAHEEILRAFQPTAAFWNPNYVSHEEGRRLLKAVPKNFIYHLPVTAEDTFGFAKKCKTSFQRYADELVNTELILTYPTFLEL